MISDTLFDARQEILDCLADAVDTHSDNDYWKTHQNLLNLIPVEDDEELDEDQKREIISKDLKFASECYDEKTSEKLVTLLNLMEEIRQTLDVTPGEVAWAGVRE